VIAYALLVGNYFEKKTLLQTVFREIVVSKFGYLLQTIGDFYFKTLFKTQTIASHSKSKTISWFRDLLFLGFS
jgi:hypothetical protein